MRPSAPRAYAAMVLLSAAACGAPADQLTELGIALHASNAGAILEAAEVDRRYRQLGDEDPSGLEVVFVDGETRDGFLGQCSDSGTVIVTYAPPGYCRFAPHLGHEFAHYLSGIRTGDLDSEHAGPIWDEVRSNSRQADCER